MLCDFTMTDTENRIESDFIHDRSERRHWFAIRILHRLADLRMTQTTLAQRAGVSPDTLNPFLTGRLPHLPGGDFPHKVASVLGLDFSRTHAPMSMGGYERAKFARILNRTYRTFKPSPTDPNVISVFRTRCFWSENDEFASFEELGRKDVKNHWGSISNYIDTQIFYFLSFSPRGKGYRQICINIGDSGIKFGGFLSSTYTDNYTKMPFISPIYYIALQAHDKYQDGSFDFSLPAFDEVRQLAIDFECKRMGLVAKLGTSNF